MCYCCHTQRVHVVASWDWKFVGNVPDATQHQLKSTETTDLTLSSVGAFAAAVTS